MKAAIVVFVLTALAYLPCVRYEFVAYDDYKYVYRNANVLTGATAGNLLWAVKSCGYADNWHPLTWISLQLDATVLDAAEAGGDECASPVRRRLSSVMHAHNVMLHAANAALLCLLIVVLLRRLHPETGVSLAVPALFALLWAIHPLRTEVVCWVSERKELLSVFFMLLTMIAYAKGVVGSRSRTVEISNSFLHLRLFSTPSFCYAFSFFTFTFSLLAKPVAVTLPVVLLAWDWVVSGRGFRRSFVAILPFLILAAGGGLLTLAAQREMIDVGSQFSLTDRAVMSLTAPVVYLRQTFWPVGLSAFYPRQALGSWIELGLGAVLAVGSAAICVGWLFRRRSAAVSLLAFAVAWCHVSLVPMLGIVKAGDQPHSDRYTYWIGCGFSAVAAIFVCRHAGRYGKEVTRALAVAVAALAVATLCRMPVWRDTFSLYSDGAPKSWACKPVRSLARLLRQRGEEGERQAEALLREAITRTRYQDLCAEFAYLLAVRTERSEFHLGENDPAFAESRYEAQAVLETDPTHSIANEALAIVEMKEGKWERALRHLAAAREKSEDTGRIDGYSEICRKRIAESGVKR